MDMIAGSFPKEVKSIGIVMSHRAEMVASMLAAGKGGAMYVPAEPSFPTVRIRYMMEEAQVDFVLTEKEYENKLDGLPVRLTDCEICGLEMPASDKNDGSSSAISITMPPMPSTPPISRPTPTASITAATPPRIADTISKIAVSYTHLDVYKRQP